MVLNLQPHQILCTFLPPKVFFEVLPLAAKRTEPARLSEQHPWATQVIGKVKVFYL